MLQKVFSTIHLTIHLTKMMHINALRESLQKNNIPFNCGVWKANGEIMYCKNVVCTSTFFEKDSANLLFLDNREVRKVKLKCFFEFNDQEIYL